MLKTFDIAITVSRGSVYKIQAETIQEAEKLAIEKAHADFDGYDIDICASIERHEGVSSSIQKM